MKLKNYFYPFVFTFFVFCPFFASNIFAADSNVIFQTNDAMGMQWGATETSTIQGIVNVAQSLQLTSSLAINSVDVKLARFNPSFSDNVFITIRSDNNNSPSDSILATSDYVNGSNILPLCSQSTIFVPQNTIVRFNFTAPYVLAPNTRYWFVMERTNYFNFSFIGANQYINDNAINFYVNSYGGGVSNLNGVMKYFYPAAGWPSSWIMPSSDEDLWFVINNTVDSPSQFWSKVQNSPAGSLDLRQTAGTENKSTEDIIETIANGRAIQVLSTSDDSYINSVDVDGYRWYKVEDMTNGKIGWAEAKSLNDGTIYLGYEQNNQASLENEAIDAKPYTIEQLKTSSYITGGNLYVQNLGLNINVTNGNLSLNNVVFRIKKQDGVEISDSCKWQAQVFTLNSANQIVYPRYFGSIKSAQEINAYTDFTDVKFTFDSVTLYNNTKYHILIYTPYDSSCSGGELPAYAYDNEDLGLNTSAQWTRFDYDRFDLGYGDLYFKINDTEQQPARTPLIIVPGIMGSYLTEASTSNQVWLNLLGYALPGEDSGLRRLEMFPLGGSIDSLVVDNTIEKVMGEDFYSGLIQELKNNGYKEGIDLFVFPYDWRYDINCLAGSDECPDQGIDNLNTEISRVLTSTGSEKVDIVAHSMGGLITKAYIEKFGTSTIDKLITIATPNLGSPRAAKMLLYGDNMDIGKFGYYVLNESTMKEVSQNIPSVYDLLPSHNYFNLSGSYIADIYDADSNGVKGNLNYSDTNDFLANTGRNRYLLNNAVVLHDKLDGLEVKNSFSISGCKTPTINKIYVLNKEKSGKYEYALRYASGDGTVPLISSENFGTQKYYTYPADHGKISSSNGVRQLVGAILGDEQSNFDFSQYQNVSATPAGCNLSGTQISFHSPVTLSAYDQYGNHVGKTDNGDTEINIPGAQYDEIDGNKFIFLPSGGNHTITGQATASGSFNARVETVQDGQYIKESYFNEVPLAGTSTKVGMTIIDNQESFTIKVDQNGDGKNVEEITPDSVLTEMEMNDFVKPATIISPSGIQGNNGYYISAIKIDLAATDDNSGILKTEYSFDAGNSWIKYNGEFNVFQDGTTTILYSSTDKAGNREDNKTAAIRIDQTMPIISQLLPQEGQEVLHSDKLNVIYFATDNFSGIVTATAKIYLDGNLVSTSTIDMFNQNIGTHQIKITIQDLAGNQAAQIVNFSLIASVDSAISDVNREYVQKMITNVSAKNGLITSLTDIKTFQEKYGQTIDAEKVMRDKAMAQCLKQKNQTWCNQKIGNFFNIIQYQLSSVNKALIRLKYNLLQAQLNLFYSLKWINQAGYNIMNGDIKYLINKI